MISDTQVRRWLSLLRRPDRLAATELAELLVARGIVPPNAPAAQVGTVASEFLVGAIDRLRPPDGSGRDRRLPHLVLRTCFVDGAKLFQAANKLGMSERQLSRERTWAVGLLRTEIEARLNDAAARPARPAAAEPYRGQPIPAIGDYLRRPRVLDDLKAALAEHRCVVVAGPPGIGKTSLVAELATTVADGARVFWYRFRPGVSDSLRALQYELGEVLRGEGDAELAGYIGSALPDPDVALATRLAITALDGVDRLLVFDDFHVVERDRAIPPFVDEVVTRLPRVRVVVVSRHQDAAGLPGSGFAVPVFSRQETKALLAQLRVSASARTVDALHAWTNGVPHLVHLAAAWLRTASPREVDRGLAELEGRAAVQEFLLGTITELLDSDDLAILQAASIFRGPFSDEGLAAVAGRSRGAVLDASRRLVRAHAATRSRDGSCAFFHASVREYVHDRLSAEQRALLHPRAAEWFDRLGQPDEAAYHRAEAAAAAAERQT